MSYVTYGGMVSPAQIDASVGQNNVDLKRSLRTFNDTLRNYMLDYADPTKGMVIGGRYFTATEKTSPAAALLMQTDVSMMQERITTLVNIWTALYQLEKGIGGASG